MEKERRHHHPMRRKDDSEIDPVMVKLVKDSVATALSEHFPVRKNGESWPNFLGKILSDVRVVLLLITAVCSSVAMVYSIGRSTYRLETVGQQALDAASATAATNARQAEEIQAQRRFIEAQAAAFARAEQMHATKDDLRRLTEQVKSNVSSRDFTRTINEQVSLPIGDLRKRLDRIEQQGRQ